MTSHPEKKKKENIGFWLESPLRHVKRERDASCSLPSEKEAGGNNYFLEKESLHAKFNYSERSPISQTSEFYVLCEVIIKWSN